MSKELDTFHERPGRILSYVELNVSEIGKSTSFYSDVFGLKAVAPPDWACHRKGGRKESWLDARPVLIRLVQTDDAELRELVYSGGVALGPWHLAFKAESVSAVSEKARSLGAQFVVEPHPAKGGLTVTFFQDPDGILFEVIEGGLQFDEVLCDDLADRERKSLPAPGDPPRFHHLAINVADRANFATDYQRRFGFQPVGDLALPSAGLMVRHVADQATYFELFEMSDQRYASKRISGGERRRIRGIGLHSHGEDKFEEQNVAAPLEQCYRVDRDGLLICAAGAR